MSLYLFTSLPSSGHINSLLKIARRLKKNGNEVYFATLNVPEMIKKINNEGFDVLKIPIPLSALPGLLLLPFTSGYAETSFAIRIFFGKLNYYANKSSEILKKLNPDCVISDFAFPGAYLAAEENKIPFVIIYHAGLAYSGPGIPPFATGLPIGGDWGVKGKIYKLLNKIQENKLVRDMNNARKKLRLPEGRTSLCEGIHSPWLTLVLTTEAGEAPRDEMRDTTFWIGPCIEQEDNAIFNLKKFRGNKKIYVSLGTVFNDKPSVFRKIIKALENSPHDIIVSCGKSYNKLSRLNLPDNVHLFQSVPQLRILELVNAVITHGGNNTVNETLFFGIPMLVMPVGGEQQDNAARIEYLGTGLRANIKNFTANEILNKINMLLENQTYLKKSQSISREIKKTDGIETAVKMIETVTLKKKPLVRKKGQCVTVTREDLDYIIS